jgi:hypothetical protein
MTYLIPKSKYKVLSLLLNKKQSNNEMVEISEEKYNELKTVDSSLECEIKQPKYYWYGGQTDPEIDTNIVTEDGVSGWRLITDGYTYNATINPIYDEEYKTVAYCALPKDGTVKIKDDHGNINAFSWPFVKEITFNDITYNVYVANETEQFSGFTIFK